LGRISGCPGSFGKESSTGKEDGPDKEEVQEADRQEEHRSSGPANRCAAGGADDYRVGRL
jgi:hypothetical protein